MLVLAHAADFVIFGPVLIAVVWISIKSVLDRRRDAAADRKPEES